jgi:hypothetical protein
MSTFVNVPRRTVLTFLRSDGVVVGTSYKGPGRPLGRAWCDFAIGSANSPARPLAYRAVFYCPYFHSTGPDAAAFANPYGAYASYDFEILGLDFVGSS